MQREPVLFLAHEQVAAALARLDEIEEGYRSFHASMSEIVHAFPRTVNECNERCDAKDVLCFSHVKHQGLKVQGKW